MLLLLRMQKMGMPHGIGCRIQIRTFGIWAKSNSRHESIWWFGLWLLVVLVVQHDANGRARQVCMRQTGGAVAVAGCRFAYGRRGKELDPRPTDQTNPDSHK